MKIEKKIAFDKHSPELFFVFYFNNTKSLSATLKNQKVADLTHFSTKCSRF